MGRGVEMVIAKRDLQDCVLQYMDMLAKTGSAASFLRVGIKKGWRRGQPLRFVFYLADRARPVPTIVVVPTIR